VRITAPANMLRVTVVLSGSASRIRRSFSGSWGAAGNCCLGTAWDDRGGQESSEQLL
jgi:hypothetical protein